MARLRSGRTLGGKSEAASHFSPERGRPRAGGETVQSLQAERIESKGDTGDRGINMLAVEQTDHRRRGLRRGGRGFDDDRDAVVQPDVFENLGESGCAVVGQTAALGALRSGEDKMKAVGAALPR